MFPELSNKIKNKNSKKKNKKKNGPSSRDFYWINGLNSSQMYVRVICEMQLGKATYLTQQRNGCLNVASA